MNHERIQEYEFFHPVGLFPPKKAFSIETASFALHFLDEPGRAMSTSLSIDPLSDETLPLLKAFDIGTMSAAITLRTERTNANVKNNRFISFLLFL